MLDDLSRIANALRELGVPVSIEQQVDAAKALIAVDPLDRDEVFAALSAVLVRREEHLPALRTLLDITLNSANPGASGLMLSEADDDELRSTLASAMRHFDKLTLRLVAAEAVRRHSGFAPGRPVGGAYYVTRTLRWLDLDKLEQELFPIAATGLDRLIASELSRSRMQFVRDAVDTVVRGMLVADRGVDELVRLRRAPLLDDIDIMHASAEQIRQLERTIVPVARKLARRLSRKSHMPHLTDMRQTIRSAMAHGGVVLDLVKVKRRTRLPRIVVLADVSGSVASFAQFTISLLRAMAQVFSRAHYFAFVDGLVEITKEVSSSEVVDLGTLLAGQKGLIRADGRTDYGNAFQSFLDQWDRQLDENMIVLILGDGRNNYRASGEEALSTIASRVRRVHWLNPEAKENWGQGDSAMSAYGKHLTSVVECRNLGQLQRFVSKLV